MTAPRRWMGIDEYFAREGLSWAEVAGTRPGQGLTRGRRPFVDLDADQDPRADDDQAPGKARR